MPPTPTDNIDRDPDLIRTAINIISKLDTNTYADLFQEFNEFTRNTAREFRGTAEQSPLIVAGMNLNTNTNTIEHISEPCSMHSSPVKPHPDKPEHLIEYDVLAVLQPTDFLDTPEHIQGALLQQLTSQWHIVSMLNEHADANTLEQLSAFQELETLLRELTDPNSLNQSPPGDHTHQPHPTDTHSQEKTNHLFAYQDGVECRYCNAFYTYDEFNEAIECCPDRDTNTNQDDTDILKKR